MDQLLERYLDQFDGAAATLTLYRGYVRNHLSPFLGKIKAGALDADTLDAFSAELRRCRDHCSGRPVIQHRTAAPHRCDQHRCRPLGATTIRHMHFILSGAYKRAVRWKWVIVNPLTQAQPPAAPVPNPHPLSASEAARIVNESWKGALIWLAMTTGAHRGELCALRWSGIDLTPDRAVMWGAGPPADQRDVRASRAPCRSLRTARTGTEVRQSREPKGVLRSVQRPQIVIDTLAEIDGFDQL